MYVSINFILQSNIFTLHQSFFKVTQYGRSFNVPYKEAYTRPDYTVDMFPVNPFVWRNSLYMVTYGFAIYRIVSTGKLALKRTLKF